MDEVYREIEKLGTEFGELAKGLEGLKRETYLACAGLYVGAAKLKNPEVIEGVNEIVEGLLKFL